MQYAIIGNSAAAVGAIEAIRAYDQENPITVLSHEPYHVYSRPLISYLLAGSIDESRMCFRPPDFYNRYRVKTLLGVEVVRIDPGKGMLTVSGGGTVRYDRLLIATGGKPIRPPVKGAGLEGIFTFTCWEDAHRIDHYIRVRKAESALVLGGGLVGLKATEALLARGIPVTVVDLADRILSLSFDRTASDIAENVLRKAGVDIRMQTTVEEFTGTDGRVENAILRDGERLKCDLAVLAVGVCPNISLVPKNCAIRVDRGILVNPCMRTGEPSIYAAGDCVEVQDSILDSNRPIAIWPHAYRQGYVAGCNMAGEYREYEGGFPMNSVEICQTPTISVGLTDPKEEIGRYEFLQKYKRDPVLYKKLVLRDNRLVGAIFIGDISRAGIYTGLIRDWVDVSPFKQHLLAGNFGLVSLPREYRKHLVVGDGIEV